MKTIEFSRPENGVRLFKPELKFMDFWYVTNDYLKTTTLSEKTKKEMMIRIHDFSIQLRETFDLYLNENKKSNQKIYDEITAGLKESVRRAKISMARNKAENKTFAGYWKFLANVLKEDSVLLKDESLQNAIHTFEQNVNTIEVC